MSQAYVKWIVVVMVALLSSGVAAKSELAMILEHELQVMIVEEAVSQHGERFLLASQFISPSQLSEFLRGMHMRGELDDVTRPVRVVLPSLSKPERNFGVVTLFPSGHVESTRWAGPRVVDTLTHTYGVSRVLLEGQQSAVTTTLPPLPRGSPNACDYTGTPTTSRYICYNELGLPRYERTCTHTRDGDTWRSSCTTRTW